MGRSKTADVVAQVGFCVTAGCFSVAFSDLLPSASTARSIQRVSNRFFACRVTLQGAHVNKGPPDCENEATRLYDGGLSHIPRHTREMDEQRFRTACR